MTWIDTIAYEDADGALLSLYDRIKGPDNNVDNIMLAHSLRPHTMEGHMSLYKHVLHYHRNAIEKWFLEALGTYTSLLNECIYCVEHHHRGMTRLIDDNDRSSKILSALETDALADAFDKRQVAALAYARRLTIGPAGITETDIISLRNAGWDDGEILEINQVVSYFNYANRTVLGLGITTIGDVLGLSPGNSTNPDNWQHG
jgi:uncharacterized peroxidase-related enzyme